MPDSQSAAGVVEDRGVFDEYIERREKNPSDDLMTELLNATFTDVTGTVRTLSRQEILAYVGLLAGAGNETTTRLIGWAGKLLASTPISAPISSAIRR